MAVTVYEPLVPRPRLGLVCLLLASSCRFSADYSNTSYRCDESETCPPGFECVDGECLVEGHCEPTGEEVCDCEDNDCDGMKDEGLGTCVCMPDDLALFPWNGYTTGSALATSSMALRPTFRWESVAASSGYEIEIDDSCDVPFSDCKFPSPEVSTSVQETTFTPETNLPVSTTAPPVGRRYYWRVRSCRDSDCDEWSRVRYLDVGRLPDDFNGDGYSDLLVGAAAYSTFLGLANVYLGSATGYSLAVPISNPQATDTNGAFGFSVAALGDVNGDGFADAAIGALFHNFTVPDEGGVYVYLGATTGLPSIPSVTLNNPAGAAATAFGFSIGAAGDLNGDGYADFALGASSQSAGATTENGVAYLYYGSASGPKSTPVTLSPPETVVSQQFGLRLSGGGDLDGDGLTDLVVSAVNPTTPGWGTPNHRGEVFVFRGGPEGASQEFDFRFANPTEQVDGNFGAAIASSDDLNSDGYADLVVGAQSQDAPEDTEGNVFIYYGSTEGPATVPSVSLDNPADLTLGVFGVAITTGDLNGDGAAELVVGATGQQSTGAIYVFQGAATGIAQTPTVTIPNPEGQLSPLGSPLASGDANGDGYGDLFAADPQRFTYGAVLIFHGSLSAPGGITATPSTALLNPTFQAGSQFGAAIARNWIFDSPEGPCYLSAWLPNHSERPSLSTTSSWFLPKVIAFPTSRILAPI